MPTPLLVLFDIDGTLLLDDRYAHGRAMLGAATDVYGVTLAEDAVQAIEPWGKTDRRIIGEVLGAAGLGSAEVAGGLARWITAAGERFARAAADVAPTWTVRPGLVEGIDVLRRAGLRLAPLTGNLRDIAAVKLEHMGVGDAFDLGAGAYGDDSAQRADLPALARGRAGGQPASRAVIVGDTPADLEAAGADGMHCLLFENPRLDAAARRGADAVVEDMPALCDALLRMSG